MEVNGQIQELSTEQRLALIANEAVESLRRVLIETAQAEAVAQQARQASPDELLTIVLNLRLPIYPTAVYGWAEAARVLGCSERSLRRWTERDKHPLIVRRKGAWSYFLGQDLLDFLKQD